MAKQPYKYETKNGEFHSVREYNIRKSSGIVGERTVKLSYTDAEMVLLMKKLNIEVFEPSVTEAIIFKTIVGADIGRVSKSVISEDAMKPHVAKIESVMSKVKDISAEDFSTRLTAYADKSRLNKAQTDYLRTRFAVKATVADDIEF